ncbi:MAG: GNAT family N-acetyltransferase [Desulfobacterales bacterium]|nr:MAG: GNAT family N-acetyltransferase [Desulfobacterales bacterium]
MIWKKADFVISSEKEQVDIDALHSMLSRSHWAKGRSREAIEKTIANSLCFSLINANERIGFARVITDGVTYAVVLDMIIREDFRGQGLGKWLLQCIGEHPEVVPLRQVLWTSAAVDFYQKSGFEKMSKLKFMARNWKM